MTLLQAAALGETIIAGIVFIIGGPPIDVVFLMLLAIFFVLFDISLKQ